MRLTKRAKRRLAFIVVLAVVGTVAVFTITAVQRAQRERMRHEERELGLAAFERGDMSATLDHLKIAVQYGQDDLDVILAFAEARSAVPMPNRAHLHEARVYYEHALDLAERNDELENRDDVVRDILTKLLQVRGMLGERIEMERVADRLLADDPTNIEALTAKVTACIADRRFDEAMPIAEQLAELEPGAVRWLHVQLQIMRSMRALDSDILAKCDEWIAGFEGDGRMHLLKAAWLYELGYMERGQRAVETAVERGASTLEVLQQMLSLLGLMDRHDLIATVVARTRDRYAEAPWARHAVIQYAWRSGQIPDALAELERAEQEIDEWPLELQRDRVLVMLVANRLGEARDALASYRVAVQSAGNRNDSVAASDELSLERDRALLIALDTRLALQPAPWPEMIRQFDEASAIAPTEPMIHYMRGETLARAGEHALAAESFQAAATLDPTWVAASVAHADSLLALGRIEEAFEVARATARRAPRNNLAPLLSLAQAAIQLNRLPMQTAETTPTFESEERFSIETARRAAAGMDVVGLMRAIHEQLPAHPQAFSLLIDALMQKSRDGDALEHMKQWLEQRELSVEQLVVAAELVRQYDLDARALLERRLREFRGDDPRVPMAHAWLLAQAGDETAGLAIVDHYFATAPSEVTDRDTVQLARVAYYLSIDHDSASEKLREVIERYPASVPVQSFALGRSDVWQSQPLVEKAISNLAAALGDRAQQVRLARASYLLRFSADKEEERARAVVIVQDVLEETPTSLVALTLLADAYLKSPGGLPMYEQAVEALQTAVDTHPREVTLYPRLISLLQQLGRYDQAHRYLVLLGRLNSSSPDIARAEVQLLLSQGDFERALMRATTFMSEESGPSDVLLLAVMHDRTGQADKARELFEQLLEQPDATDMMRTQAAEFFARHGEFERGYELLKNVLAEDEDPGSDDVMLGWFSYRHGDESRALSHFEQAVKTAPTSGDAWHALTRFHLSRDDYEAAETTAGEGLDAVGDDERLRADLALAVAGQSGQSWRMALGRLALQANDVAALLETLELAASIPVSEEGGDAAPTERQLDASRALIQKHARFLPGWYLAIAMHANAGELTRATELSRSAMTRFPTRPEPAEWAVRLFMQSDRWSEALSAAEEWAARAGADPIGPACASATAMLRLDRAASAAERLRPHAADIVAARESRPEHAMVLIDTMLAAGEVDRLMTVGAPMLDERIWRRRWAFAARSVAPAVTASVLMELEARAVDDDEPQAAAQQERLVLAGEWQQLAERTGDHQWLERSTRLAEAVAADAESDVMAATAEFVLATIAETRGDIATAESRYRAVITAQPDHALAMNNLAYLLFSHKRGGAEALELAQRAANLMPESPDILDTLGVVLLAAGKPAEAEAQLRKALQARPDDVDISLNLVDAIIHQQKFDEASRQLELLQRTLRRLPDRGVQYQERVQELKQRIQNQVTMAR